MSKLSSLRRDVETASDAFDTICRLHYVDGRWGYYKAVECDQPIPNGLHERADAYLVATHAFYLARDGVRGCLGGRNPA